MENSARPNYSTLKNLTHIPGKIDPVINEAQGLLGGLRKGKRFKKSLPGKPLISIITPVFNGNATFEKTILSVLGQSYDNIEYIVVDGNSKDGTLDIIQKYAQAIDFWVSEADSGIYDAMNKGLRFATGDWVYFLGGDDLLVNSLNSFADKLTSSNTVYYGDVYWKSKNIVYDGPFNAEKITKKNICHQAIIYPRKVFTLYKYELKYKILADYDLNLKLFSDNRFKFKYISKLISVYAGDGRSAYCKDMPFNEDKPKLVKKLAIKRMFEKVNLKNRILRMWKKIFNE